VRTPIDIDVDLWDETEPLFEDVYLYMRLVSKLISKYKRLISKLIYLTITRSNIAY